MKLIRSMTGYARVRETIQSIDAVISIKTVNHRGMDIHFHMGSDLDPFENAMRGAIKRSVARGHLDLRVNLSRAGSAGALDVDRSKLDAYVSAFRQTSERHGLTGEPDLNSAFRVPGVLSDASTLELGAEFEKPLMELLQRGLDLLNEFRAREGAGLVEVIRERNAAIYQSALKIEEHRGRALEGFHNRLKERLSDLLAGANVDPQRLAQEAAILADRSDIGEEIARLKIHSRHLDEILGSESEIGKKLDFLSQEMNRETNTILSKTSGIGESSLGITEVALATKSDIEKIREQALNLE
jgi:TIGR00255 family protein